MRSRSFRRFMTFTFILLGIGVLSAHHSGTMFDPTKVKEISGTVKEFQWKNPHVWIQLYVQNGGRQEEWSIEGGSPNTLSRNGWRPSTFAPGASVSIKVNPMKDGSAGGQFIGAKFADGRTIGNWDRD
ncbi:MAG TPA: DUF6152 family protein [Vicinamibacterales bacterium]|nr:DUF6152 family protein [Vicinamibacterales bacterium]